MRRAATVALAAACLLIVAPLAALAASAAIDSPRGTVAEPEPIRVVVGDLDCFGNCNDGTADDRVDSVRVDLRRSGDTLGSVNLRCVDACSSEQQLWGGLTLDPREATAFGAPDGFCNGAWALRAVVSVRDTLGNTETRRDTRSLVVSAPPAASGGMSVEGGQATAEVSWQAVDHPDVTGYRVQRDSGGGWTTLATVGAGTTSYTDDAAPAGDVTYRIITLGADGVVDDRAVSSCDEDSGRDLSSLANSDGSARFVAASGSVQPAPTPTPSPTESDDGGPADGGSTTVSAEQGGQTGSTGSGGGSQDSGSGGSDDSDPVSAPEQPSGQSSDQQPTPTDEPSYYGEDEQFGEELDYEGVEGVEGVPSETATPSEPDEVVINEAASDGIVERFQPERVATPIAGGLLLIAFALHLRAWMNATDVGAREES